MVHGNPSPRNYADDDDDDDDAWAEHKHSEDVDDAAYDKKPTNRNECRLIIKINAPRRTTKLRRSGQRIAPSEILTNAHGLEEVADQRWLQSTRIS